MPLLTFASAIAAIVALNQLFYRTALGRAFRATSDDAVTAGLMGIEPKRIFAIATGIAMVVVTIAALYLGMRANFDPSIGPARLIYAFEAVIIGGLGASGARWPAASSSAWPRPSAPRSTRNGRSWPAISPSWSCLLLKPRGLFPRGGGLIGMYLLTTRTRAGTAHAASRCLVLIAVCGSRCRHSSGAASSRTCSSSSPC